MALETVAVLLLAPFVGSFLGVVIDRLPAGRPVMLDRSRCDACGATLGAQGSCADRELAVAARPLRSLRRHARPLLPGDRAGGARGRALRRLVPVGLAAVGELRARLDAAHACGDRPAPPRAAGCADPAVDSRGPRGGVGHRSGAARPSSRRRCRGLRGLRRDRASSIVACAAARGWGSATPSCSRRPAPGSAGRRCRASWWSPPLAALAVALARALAGDRVSATTPVAFGSYLALAFWLVWLLGPPILA